MTGVVLDASVALAWCFPDEASEYADEVLVALEGCSLLVPAVWSLEITNAMLVGERAKRLRQSEILRFVDLLETLPLIQDTQSIGEQLSNILPLAREYGLSSYDAAYLELSMRHGAPLATLDGKLRNAAKKAGVETFASKKR